MENVLANFARGRRVGLLSATKFGRESEMQREKKMRGRRGRRDCWDVMLSVIVKLRCGCCYSAFFGAFGINGAASGANKPLWKISIQLLIGGYDRAVLSQCFFRGCIVRYPFELR